MVDTHLARPVLTGNVRRVFDGVVDLPEPLEVFSSAPIPPRTVFSFDNPEELRHSPSIYAVGENSYEVKGPKVWCQ